jgi:hypothetical protein
MKVSANTDFSTIEFQQQMTAAEWDRAARQVAQQSAVSTCPVVPSQTTNHEPQATTEAAPSTPQLAALKGRIAKFFLSYKGKKLGPYYCRRWKENGKTKKEYVSSKDLPRVQAAIDQYRSDRNYKLARNKQCNLLLTNMRFLWTMMQHRIPKKKLRVENLLHIGRIEKMGIYAPDCPKLRGPHNFMAPLVIKMFKHVPPTGQEVTA